MPPDVFNVEFAAADKNLVQAGKTIAPVAERFGSQLALVAARPEEPRYRDQFQTLFQDFEREPAVQLHAGRSKEGADGSRGPALFTDHFPEVAGSNLQFQYSYLLSLDLSH